MIEAKSLRKSYGPTQAVRDISFAVERGEIVGLLGPNGAGKSTTIRMMTTYLMPDSGSITIDGLEVDEHPLEVRQLLGYMPQSSALYRDMKVLDYLRFVGRVRQIEPNRIMERIAWVQQRCGLEDILLKTIGALSNGNQQRVALAQAILHDPKILVLDEPTSGLDPNQIRAIREFIRELGREKTVFLSTHILQEVTALCSRVIIVNRGQVVADGKLDDLVAQASDQTTLTVGVSAGPSADEILDALRALEGVATVTSAGERIWRLQASNGACSQLAGKVYELASQRAWPLVELAPHRPSIEEVFHQLTEEG